MKNLVVLSCLALALCLFSGCIVRTYSVVKDRVDQEISGNQGYLVGSAPIGSEQPKKFTQRTTQVVEIELQSPVKFERLEAPPEPVEQKGEEAVEGSLQEEKSESNQTEQQESEESYLTDKEETQTPQSANTLSVTATLPQPQAAALPKVDTYIVQKGDTLQIISARPEIYGTVKKWVKIYEANKDTLSAPDKIYPGQKLKIPRE